MTQGGAEGGSGQGAGGAACVQAPQVPRTSHRVSERFPAAVGTNLGGWRQMTKGGAVGSKSAGGP